MGVLHLFVTLFFLLQAKDIFKVLSQILNLTFPGKLSLGVLVKVKTRMSLILSGDSLSPSPGLWGTGRSRILHLAQKEGNRGPQDTLSERWGQGARHGSGPSRSGADAIRSLELGLIS